MAKMLKLVMAMLLLITAVTSTQAVTLYECKGGVLVLKPADC